MLNGIGFVCLLTYLAIEGYCHLTWLLLPIVTAVFMVFTLWHRRTHCKPDSFYQGYLASHGKCPFFVDVSDPYSLSIMMLSP